MGSACSIENAQYDAEKFKQSKAIMESGADDAEKFAKLKAIWGSIEAAAAVHKGSTKDLHAVDTKAPAAASSDAKPSAGPSASETKVAEHHEPKAESHDAKPAEVHETKKEDAKPAETKKEEPKHDDAKKDDAKSAAEHHGAKKEEGKPAAVEHHEPKKEDGKPAADSHAECHGKGEDPKKHEEHAHAGEHHAEKAAH